MICSFEKLFGSKQIVTYEPIAFRKNVGSILNLILVAQLYTHATGNSQTF